MQGAKRLSKGHVEVESSYLFTVCNHSPPALILCGRIAALSDRLMHKVALLVEAHDVLRLDTKRNGVSSVETGFSLDSDSDSVYIKYKS